MPRKGKDHGAAVAPKERTPRTERTFVCMLCPEHPEFQPGGEASMHFEEKHPEQRKPNGFFPITRHLNACFTEAARETQVYVLCHPDTHELLITETIIVYRTPKDRAMWSIEGNV